MKITMLRTASTNESVRKILLTLSLYSILSNMRTEARAISKLQAKGIKKGLAIINMAIDRETATKVVVNLNNPEFVNDSEVMLRVFGAKNN